MDLRIKRGIWESLERWNEREKCDYIIISKLKMYKSLDDVPDREWGKVNLVIWFKKIFSIILNDLNDNFSALWGYKIIQQTAYFQSWCFLIWWYDTEGRASALSANHVTMGVQISCSADLCAALRFGALGIVNVFGAEIFPMYGKPSPSQSASALIAV